MGGKSSAPASPDYTAAANATGQQALNLAKYTTAANRINQTTPTGSLKYTQNPDGTWSSNTTLSDPQQQLLNQGQNLQLQAGGMAQNALTNSASSLSPLDASKLPQMPQNAGMTSQDAIMSRLAPQIQRENAATDQQLANQGIMPGSEAYNTAKTLQDQSHNDLLNQAASTGVGLDMQASGQGISNASAIQNQNLNVVNALRSGSNPNSGVSNNPGMMQTPNAPDYMGAAQGMYNAQLGQVNANNANSAQTTQAGLSAAAIAAMYFSDRRLKKNIHKLFTRHDGLNVYEFNYKPKFDLPDDKQIGVMADEVEKLYPDAVITHSSGYKMVNYSMLGI
jgi:hypothetical protein